MVNYDHPNPRKLSEQAGDAAGEQQVKVAVVRLPQVHDTQRQGLITPLIEMMRGKGVSAYVGDGGNRWSAAHVSDVARLYRLAFERQEVARYHAVAEEGITVKSIAETLGRGLDLPVRSIAVEQAVEYFGWMAGFLGVDLSASSAWTRQTLAWQPTDPSLFADLTAMRQANAA